MGSFRPWRPRRLARRWTWEFMTGSMSLTSGDKTFVDWQHSWDTSVPGYLFVKQIDDYVISCCINLNHVYHICIISNYLSHFRCIYPFYIPPSQHSGNFRQNETCDTRTWLRCTRKWNISRPSFCPQVLVEAVEAVQPSAIEAEVPWNRWSWHFQMGMGRDDLSWRINLDMVGCGGTIFPVMLFLIYLGFCFSLRPRTSTEIRWLPMLATTRDLRDLQFDEWLMAQQKLAAQLQVLCAVWEWTSSASPIQLLAGTPGNEEETLTFAMACVKYVRPWFSLVENLLWRMIWRRHQNPLEKGDWSFSKHLKVSVVSKMVCFSQDL